MTMQYCFACGKEMHSTAASCPGCGAQNEKQSTIGRGVLALVCFFLGVLGVHRFMVGKIGTGVLHLLTLGVFGLWTLIDFIVIVLGKFRDKEGRLIR